MQGIVMTDKNNDGASWDADSMIENSKSLQSVAKKLEWNGSESPQVDPFPFQGNDIGAGNLVAAGDRDRTEGMAVSRTKESSSPHSRLAGIVQRIGTRHTNTAPSRDAGAAWDSGEDSFRIRIVA